MSTPGVSWGGQQDAATAAGWYPDPDGAPGLVRWWNGVTWSDVTTPAGPGVSLAGGSGAWGPSPAPSSWSPPPRAGRAPLYVGLGVLALLVVVVVAVVLGTSGGTTATSDEQSTAPGPLPEPGTEFPPGTVRIIDQDAGISYPFLGTGWYEYDLFPQEELQATAGQYFTTQEQTPDNGIFIAQCTSGALADGYGWSGSGSLQSTVANVADSVRNNYYPLPNDQTVRRDEARTVDGAPAHVYEFDLSWDVPGYDATGERAALLLIDVGRPAPALLYLSIPNTHAELYGVIDQVLDAVEVL